MKSLLTWFVKNPVAANLLMFAMVFVGFFGLNTMEREFVPQSTFNGITVSTTWLGASPKDIEQQLLVRMEEAVDGLDGIDYIESTARESVGNLNIRTKLRIDYEKLLDEVKARVSAVQNLPPDSFEPKVFRWDARADIMYLALYGDVDRLELQREAADLRRKLTKLSGLQLTNYLGKVSEQITIEISEDKLRQYNLTFSEVSNAIASSSLNLSAGSVETTAGTYQLSARALAETQSEFENIIVRQTQDGGTLRVKDIAIVIDRFDSEKFSSTFRNQNAAVFQVLSPDTMNISRSGEEIRQFEKDIAELLPPGIKFSIWFDGSTMFDSRMELIGSNALSGMVLVLIFLMLFLRPSVAMWVTIGIAAAFLGALAVAPYFGITMNMISLFAFLLVIGIVVDDAIVVGESIYFHAENGIYGEKAAIGGANLVAKPVFFAVITTILMFIPFLLISGPFQPMFGQISLVVIAVLAFSLIEAFFILPAHLRHLKPRENESNPLLRLQNRIANSLVSFAKNVFRPIVAAIIKFRYITFSVFLGMMIFFIGLLQGGIIPSSALPEVESDMIFFEASFPEGTSFERLEEVRQQVESGLKQLNANSLEDFGVEGDIIPRAGTGVDGRQIQGFLGMDASNLRNNTSTKAIADKLEEYVGEIPDAFRTQYNYSMAMGEGGGFRYGVTSGSDIELEKAAEAIKEKLESFDKIPFAWDTLESSAQEIRINLKPDAETLGLKLGDVTRQVREAFFGREVQRVPRFGEDVRVMVRYPLEARESIDSLNNLYIRTARGVEVPLSSVADISFAEGVSQIRRRDRERIEYIGASVRGDPAGVAKIQTEMNDVFLPQWEKDFPDATLVRVGDDLIQQTMYEELTLSSIVILFVMYGLLAIAFKSYAQPLLIMVAIPFALVGMIFGNWITGVPFGIMSVFGFFAASGVAINDNLVLIDYVNRLRAQGIGAYQAMLDSCVARFRPILLTSLTTFVGIMPILFETSSQAEFLKPMVVALAFGVLFDFFLTLMLVPAMYGIGVDIGRTTRRLATGVKQKPLGSTYDPDIAIALEDFDVDALKGDLDTGPTPVPAE